MQAFQRMGEYFLIAALFIVAMKPAATAAATQTTPQPTAKHDGQHDFDFEAGAWKIHLKRLDHPLTGSKTWVEFDGTTVTRKVWDGRAWLEQFEADGPTSHIEGLTLRLYNPDSHQWRLYWANSKDGALSVPTVGEFKNGRGEFFDQESFNGRQIFVRYVWSDITANSAHFEQSFSEDGGKTWEVNWITDQTRVKDDSDKAQSSTSDSNAGTPGGVDADGQHGFDPLLGRWKYHLKRRLNPLTGSTTWADFGGTGLCQKVWDGRAELEQAEFNGPSGHIEGLVLRLYNPQSHQWSLHWANSKNGILDPPQVGEFKNGHGEFYAQDTIDGKSIFVRFDWSRMNTNSPHFEQAYSDDGGKTWEVNWITDQTRTEDDSDAAQTDPGASKAAQPEDGQHDFDFEFGSWKTHIQRLQQPLSSSNTWIDYDGTSVVRKIWNGRANLGELEVGNATSHLEGLSFRLYNPQSHQWSIYWSNSKDGSLGMPMIGGFKNGRGEFYDQETLAGTSIFVRFIFSDITPASFRLEQAFSNDGGKTWEPNWIATFTRENS